MNCSLYINGVYKSVLEEILIAQGKDPGLVCYLQPYSSSKIVQLAAESPTSSSPVTLYLSITTDLSKVAYRALIVGWANKGEIEKKRLSRLNDHIAMYQPGEKEIYMSVGNKQSCINLLSISQLERLSDPVPLSLLRKDSDGSPLKPRATAGGWSYVKPLPESDRTICKSENCESELLVEVLKSLELDESTRNMRLREAPKFPEEIQVIARGFKRNPDVVAAVLLRANGVCERCNSSAPFMRASKGTPYLEIHHKVMLSEGGEDTVANASALCPNCHRELHYGIEQG